MSQFRFPEIPGQRGLATTRQLLDAGVTPAQLQNLTRAGHRALRTVYSRRPTPLDSDDMLLAASLWAGPRSVLTGVHALEVLGHPTGVQAPLTPFLVPHTSRTRARAAGFETIRARQLPSPVMVGGLRVAPAERALADAGRLKQVSNGRLQRLAMTLLQGGRTTPDRLATEIEQGRPNATGGVHAGVVGFRRGAWSVAETWLVDGVASHPDLPAMLANPHLVTPEGVPIGTPDGYFPDAGVIVQVHSREWHTGEDATGTDRWATTNLRDLEYQQHGLVVVPVAPVTLRDQLQPFLEGLARVVLTRLGWDASRVRVARAG